MQGEQTPGLVPGAIWQSLCAAPKGRGSPEDYWAIYHPDGFNLRVRWEGGVFGDCSPEVRQVDFGSTLSCSRQWVKPFLDYLSLHGD